MAGQNRRNVRLVGKNFSSAASRSRGGSARLRSRQTDGDPGAGARTNGMATVAGTVPARTSNMKRFPGVWWMSASKRKECPMCGHAMIDIQACHDLCPNCGARLDCSDGP